MLGRRGRYKDINHARWIAKAIGTTTHHATRSATGEIEPLFHPGVLLLPWLRRIRLIILLFLVLLLLLIGLFERDSTLF